MTETSTAAFERLRVDLDVVTDSEGFRTEDLQDFLTEDMPGVHADVVDPSGPAGGWPVVRFEGTPEDILVLLFRYHEGRLDDLVHSWRHEVTVVS